MSKIKTITPVHIGSGQKIYTLKKDTYLYSIDKIIEEKVNNSSDSNLQKLLASCSYLANKTNPTKIDLFKTLSINDYSIPLSTRISNDPAYAKAIESETADLFLAQKSLDKLIIPGSSIKGMFNNLFWYHVIDSNDYIKKYFKENINRISKILNELDGTIKNMKSFLRITDIIFDSNPRVFTVKRYSSKNDCMPVGNHETISYDESTNCDFIRSLSETDVKMMDEVKKEIEKTELTEPKRIILNEYYNYVLNLKEIFPKANKKYMLEVVNKEMQFVENSSNEKFDHMSLKNFYQDIIKQLNNDKIIMQIGKMTNFLDKTFMFVLGDEYVKNFGNFKPNIKKSKPIIESMNLATIGRNYFPLGFIEIEL